MKYDNSLEWMFVQLDENLFPAVYGSWVVWYGFNHAVGNPEPVVVRIRPALHGWWRMWERCSERVLPQTKAYSFHDSWPSGRTE